MTEWTDIEAPWAENERFVDVLLDKIDFLDILEECGVEFWPCQSGDWDHRLKCPLPVHDFGGERTASMFVDSDENKFYCFGCNSGGTVIRFVELLYGISFYDAIKFANRFVNIDVKDIDTDLDLPRRRYKDPEDMVVTHVFRASVMVRDHLANLKGTDKYDEQKVWVDKQFRRLDAYLDGGDDRSNDARNYCFRLQKHLKGIKI